MEANVICNWNYNDTIWLEIFQHYLIIIKKFNLQKIYHNPQRDITLVSNLLKTTPSIIKPITIITTIIPIT